MPQQSAMNNEQKELDLDFSQVRNFRLVNFARLQRKKARKIDFRRKKTMIT